MRGSPGGIRVTSGSVCVRGVSRHLLHAAPNPNPNPNPSPPLTPSPAPYPAHLAAARLSELKVENVKLQKQLEGGEEASSLAVQALTMNERGRSGSTSISRSGRMLSDQEHHDDIDGLF